MFLCYDLFEAFAKNVRKEATKCSLETTEVLLDAHGYRCFSKFDIYQSSAAPNCFKSHTDS